MVRGSKAADVKFATLGQRVDEDFEGFLGHDNGLGSPVHGS